MSEKRTTKTVTVTVTATFYGDYIDADDVTCHLLGWIDSGLDDRDDLLKWDFGPAKVTEVDGDPDGYDGPAADGQTG